MDQPAPGTEHEELFWEEEVRRILRCAIDLRDRTMTRSDLEEMAAELGIRPAHLRAAEQRVAFNPLPHRTPRDPPTPPTGHATTLYHRSPGLLVTTEHLVIHGRIYELATVHDAAVRKVSFTIGLKLWLSGLLALLLLVLFVVITGAWGLIIFPLLVAPVLFLLTLGKQYSLTLETDRGPTSAYMMPEEVHVQELAVAVRTAIRQRNRLR